MRKIIILLVILLPVVGFAQTPTPRYSYDSLGNEYHYDPVKYCGTVCKKKPVRRHKCSKQVTVIVSRGRKYYIRCN